MKQHRKFPELIEFHVKTLDSTVTKDLDFIKVHVGEDHSKSTCMFLDILLFYRINENKRMHPLEIKSGKINEEKYHTEHIEQFLRKLSCRFYKINVNK